MSRVCIRRDWGAWALMGGVTRRPPLPVSVPASGTLICGQRPPPRPGTCAGTTQLGRVNVYYYLRVCCVGYGGSNAMEHHGAISVARNHHVFPVALERDGLVTKSVAPTHLYHRRLGESVPCGFPICPPLWCPP